MRYTGKALKVRAAMNRAGEHLTDEQALESMELYPLWASYIGKPLLKDRRVRYEDGLYKVQQEHTPQEHQPPSVHTAALYSRIMAPGSIEAWVSGQSYGKGVEVIHNGWVWLSGVDNNIWEPGAAGVYENIWKRVKEVT